VRGGRGLLALGLTALVLEAGCAIIRALSPQLTAIYNAEFSAAFFARAPMLLVPMQLVLRKRVPVEHP
jgi:hypothetical protein